METSRIRHLRERVREHRPKAVICYGLGHRRRFEQIAGPFAPAGLPRLGVASAGDTLVALIPHTSQGVSNSFLEGAGAIIAARRRSHQDDSGHAGEQVAAR